MDFGALSEASFKAQRGRKIKLNFVTNTPVIFSEESTQPKSFREVVLISTYLVDVSYENRSFY